MSSPSLPVAPSGMSRDDGCRYRIELEMRDEGAVLVLGGDLDAAAIDALRGILSCVERLPTVLHVQAAGVTRADDDAFDPLLETAATRRERDLPTVVLDSASDAIRNLLSDLALDW